MKNEKGFTLVEIMIVVAIIGLLAVIGTPGFLRARSRARKNTCWNNMRIIVDAVQQYSLEGNIPSDTSVSLYDDNIMPTAAGNNGIYYVSKYLRCPESNTDYGASINNSDLDLTCPVVDANLNHGSYSDIYN